MARFLTVALLLVSSHAFRSPSWTTRKPLTPRRAENNRGPLDFLFNPYESKIPKEIETQIYEAEGNTAAAQDRSQRIALYAVVAFTGILMAFFNGFLSELRNGPSPDGLPVVLDDAGFGWVESNFLTSFLFLNKIGGALCLLTGGAAGLLAEAEYDTRRINAEKIFEEMERRRSEKENPTKKSSGASRKKRRSGKEKKRLSALSEVVKEEGVVAPQSIKEPQPDTEQEEPKKGVLGSLKDFYDKADQMAETQARLLNKKLEDEGILEKITDETGLKVVGRDKAAKKG